MFLKHDDANTLVNCRPTRSLKFTKVAANVACLALNHINQTLSLTITL